MSAPVHVFHGKDLFVQPEYDLFNVDLNPTEVDSAECEEPETCSNLAKNSAFAHILKRMMHRWDELQEQV